MPVTFLLNAPVITDYGLWSFKGPLSVSQARDLAASAISAIGHHDTARFIEVLLETPIICSRRSIRMLPGERALVFRLLSRRDEGELVSFADLFDTPHEFGLLERTA